MPAPNLRRFQTILLLLCAAFFARVVPAGAAVEGSWERDQGREQAVRAALSRVGVPKDAQRQALQLRRAPDTLHLVVAAFDFSDSLMWGRNLDDFPGWPAQRRQSQRIPGTDIPVFSAHDADYFDLQLSRVDSYFRTVSFDRFSMQWEVYPEILNLPHPMGWFADPDSGTVRLARAAQDIAEAIDPFVDFSGIDTFVLIHAGAGSETDVDNDSPDQIPSNYLDRVDFEKAVEAGALDQPWIATGETELHHVLVLPESETQDPVPGKPGSGFFDVRGVYCFEFGLRLGMLSLTDFTPASFPDSQGIGNFGLMGYGLFTGLGVAPAAPSAINRMLMGWADPVEVVQDGDLRIVPMLASSTAAGDTNLVRVPITDREYWLLEYRLQDPDGDLFYGFGDLNGNRWPDYFDSSNATNGGWPNTPFDPVDDQWEDEYGAEVDFFMSENPVRPRTGCREGGNGGLFTAGGSGLYIWHIDEQVIENALAAGTNTINADPRHKGVDVEEADGIQDLDSPYSGLWLLGGDDDVWRGEGGREFGPDSSPSTASAAGVPTQLRFHGFSKVGLDTLPEVDGVCPGLVYAPAMRVSVEFGAGGDGPVEQARLRTDGFGPQSDLRVVDLGGAAGTLPPDGVDEIVALADSGRVLVLSGDLAPFGNSVDGEPGVIAVATAGDSLRWTGPAAVLDLDQSGDLDVVAGSNAGIFGFGQDGSELLDGDMDPATNGRLADPGGQGLGPVVWGTYPTVVQSVQSGEGLVLMSVRASGGTAQVVRSQPVAGAVGSGRLVVREASLGVDPDPGIPEIVWTGFSRNDRMGVVQWSEGETTLLEPAPDGFASSPVVGAALGGGSSDVRHAWFDEKGRLVAGWTDAQRTGPVIPGPRSAPVAIPAGAYPETGWVIACTTVDALYAFDANLAIRPGFPVRVAGDVSAPEDARPVEPAAVDLDGDGIAEFVWCDLSGGIHATDLSGREMPGWPVQGPATPVSAPSLGQFDDDAFLEMAVAGRFERLVVGGGGSAGPRVRPAGDFRVYDLGIPEDSYRPWNQALGRFDNRATQWMSPPPAAGSGLDGDSFSVRPNPATGSVVWLRADAAGDVEARLDIYTLEGERVLSKGPFAVPAGTALDVEFRIEELGSGTYICQLTAGGSVQRRVLAVVR